VFLSIRPQTRTLSTLDIVYILEGEWVPFLLFLCYDK